eukprot:TRINITY_DN6930_c0_g1_i4.p1 TRINITY_DN6930_c0_g1~~TRINITY_DN6930_c0_g1_i4.p1  ORF type:complete len:238 (-),score=59.08 TRINITY_DN6930_c0_g1_i4:277-990(-)
MIRRPPRSTLSSSSAASDVYKRQYQRRVREIWIAPMAQQQGSMGTMRMQHSPSQVRVQVPEAPPMAPRAATQCKVSSQTHRRLMYGVHAIILLDMSINSVLEYGIDLSVLHGIGYGVQLLLFGTVMVLLGKMFSQTFVLQAQLMGILLMEFRGLVASMVLYFFALLGFRVASIANLVSNLSSNTSTDLWGSEWHYVLMLIQRTAMVWYYYELASTTFRIGEARWYRESGWLDRLTMH